MTPRIITAALLLIVTSVPVSAQAIRLDHQLHIGAGALLYGGSRAVGMRPGTALTICAAVGVLKEIRDAQGHGTPELSDAVATLLPCLVAWAFETHEHRPRAIIQDLRVERRRMVDFYEGMRR